ncbi:MULTISPECIES: hypothetical protein [unclassified Streptomyces]|uniref:hypothetical protein n=1 Tax=Streptomyces sp. NPDC055082 TaxID=3365718 RepID=UPI0037D8E62E
MPWPLGPADPRWKPRFPTEGGHGLLAAHGPTKAYTRAQERCPALGEIAGEVLGGKP